MITVFTISSLKSAIEKMIADEEHLAELVDVHLLEEKTPLPTADHLIVDERGIVFTIDWYNSTPPYLLPQPLPFLGPVLIGLIYLRLSNYEKAYRLLEGRPELLHEVDTQVRLAQNIEFDKVIVTENDYRSYHNAAVVAQYGEVIAAPAIQEILGWYTAALHLAPNDELKAFSAKHYATLLADSGDNVEAEHVLQDAIGYAITEDARIELKALLSSIWLSRLSIPYDTTLLEQLKNQLWQCLTFYEDNKRPLQAALILMDASQVANFSESFSEALGYVSKAAEIFRREEQPELLAQAQMRKGTLLYTWAQQGNPQFYRPAMEALQEGLKIFTREAAPDLFAEIHHLLGIIYSEIPDEVKKKSVWAAVSSSSFKEALNYFTKENFPYEYATICTHYGNAYLKYPASRNSDNFAKSLELFREALHVRTADRYPLERALTLLNYLEAAWYVDLTLEKEPEMRVADMEAKAKEIFSLTQEEKLRAQARDHLLRIDELKKIIQSSTSV